MSLSPSATEVVSALGAAPQLVGVDDYSTWPAEVAKLPKVGSFLMPNLEAIVGLHPTLVIVDDVHGPTAAKLHDAGVATVECAMHALPDVKDALRAVGQRLGRDPAAAVAKIDAALEAAAAKRPARHPRVLAIIDREAGGLGNLVAVGAGTYVDELLAVVGGDNVLAGAGVRYPKLSMEEVLRTRPEVILDLSYAAETSVAEWKDVPAKVVALGPVGHPYLAHPSVRIDEALAALAGAIR